MLSTNLLLTVLSLSSVGYANDDMNAIIQAAKNNGCQGEDFRILLSIRKAENGPKGRELESFNPAVARLCREHPDQTLFIQASWCSATIVKNRKRWLGVAETKTLLRILVVSTAQSVAAMTPKD